MSACSSSSGITGLCDCGDGYDGVRSDILGRLEDIDGDCELDLREGDSDGDGE